MARTFPFPGLGTLTAQYAGVEQDIYAKGSPEPLDAYVAGYGLQTASYTPGHDIDFQTASYAPIQDPGFWSI
jgi:hypothetical protein